MTLNRTPQCFKLEVAAFDIYLSIDDRITSLHRAETTNKFSAKSTGTPCAAEVKLTIAVSFLVTFGINRIEFTAPIRGASLRVPITSGCSSPDTRKSAGISELP
jgi:hypothetical protein